MNPLEILSPTNLQNEQTPTPDIPTSAVVVEPQPVLKTYEESYQEILDSPLNSKLKIIDTEVNEWILSHKSQVYFNALDVPDCNLTGVSGMFFKGQKNDAGNKIFSTLTEGTTRAENFIDPFLTKGEVQKFDDGTVSQKKCAIYCAHDTCSAAFRFMKEHEILFNRFCSEINYLKPGIKGISSDYGNLVKTERTNREEEKREYIDTGVKLVNHGNCINSLGLLK